MTHRSSIADGSAYARGYGCGDSPISLEEWIPGYLVSGGAFFEAAENFHSWAPGERYEYNNVAFGLLAYLVEVISGTSFNQLLPKPDLRAAWNDRQSENERRKSPNTSYRLCWPSGDINSRTVQLFSFIKASRLQVSDGRCLLIDTLLNR